MLDEASPITKTLGAQSETSEGSSRIIGTDPALRNVLAIVARVAKSDCTLLVTGESGTGKELVVEALHQQSERAARPLVTVNCGAIPENLLESELFGYARGAFTGAHADKPGVVAAAEGGTLFLDEVGELPLALQVKILRFLQQREYSPVGDRRVFKCNVRVVAATNRDLEEEVARARFREDLFYRLNVIHVHLPALRERRGDIEPLATHFFRASAARAGRHDLEGFTPEAIEMLVAHAWPGNVRALENTIERAVLLAAGPRIDGGDLPDRLQAVEPPAAIALDLPVDGINLPEALDALETRLVRQALERTGGNRNQAAKLLGINRTTLLGIMKRRGLT